MTNKEVKLSVQDLKISFRTDAGKVQAVRDISFDLYKGETLAIVGESGSGKSVTSRAIMGILAGNSIKEGGEIIYDGQDLMKICEEDFHSLRGDKIAMIFQDPMSSLNPIMRIGKQITEAMLLKNKANRKEGRKTFNSKLGALSNVMKQALAAGEITGVTEADIDGYIKTFDSFTIEAIKLENSYNAAHTAAEEMIAIIEDFLFLTEKKQKVDTAATIKLILNKLADINDKYFIAKQLEQLTTYAQQLNAALIEERQKTPAFERIKLRLGMAGSYPPASPETLAVVQGLKETAEQVLAQPKYNFFRIGYYVYKKPETDFSQMSAEQANEIAIKFLNEDFMDAFRALEKAAVQYSTARILEQKKQAIDALDRASAFFRSGNYTQHEAEEYAKRLSHTVLAAIDPLEIVKDNVAHTFPGALASEIGKYFFYLKNNPKEELRFARQTAKREALLAKGKSVDWTVVPKSVIDPQEQIDNILSVLHHLSDKFRADVASADRFDAELRCVQIIDYLKERPPRSFTR